MDSAQAILKQVADEVVSSAEWRELNREFLIQLEQAQYLCGRGEQTDFTSLSDHDKAAAVSRATKAVENTKPYRDAREKISSTIDRVLCVREGGAGIATKLSGDAVKDATRACGYLLERWPNLVGHLKTYLNHPLPAEMRAAAWKARLKPAYRVRSVAPAPAPAGDGGPQAQSGAFLSEQSAEEARLCQRCEELLSSKAVFASLSDSIGVLKAMKGVTLLAHRANPGSPATDTDLLLCVPFLYARREDLGRHSHDSDGVFPHLVVDVADQYEAFMRIRPMTMSNADERLAAEAMAEFESRVKHLLSSHDPALWQLLSRTLHRATGPLRKELKSLIHPFIQRMFVGDVSLDVVCYIWDQCFIGMDTAAYQCLPYITATWIILLKEKLMACNLDSEMENVFVEESQKLTVWQFQKEISSRFLPALSAALLGNKAAPSRRSPKAGPPRGDRGRSPEADPPRGDRGRSPEADPPMGDRGRSPEADPPRRDRGRSPEADPSQATPSNTSSDSSERAVLVQHVPPSPPPPSIQHVPPPSIKKIQEMEKELKQKHQQLESAIARERRHDQQRRDNREPPLVARATRRSLPPVLEHPPRQWSVANSQTSLTTPLPRNTRQNVRGVISSQLSIASAGTNADPGNTPVRGATRCREGEQEAITARAFSPSHLTTEDAQDIWIRIFERFTGAANLLCHGPSSS